MRHPLLVPDLRELLHSGEVAGIRDFLMSAAGTDWLWGALQARLGRTKAKDYTSFHTLIPGNDPNYDFLAVNYSADTGIGKDVYVRYGEVDMQRVVFNAHYLAYCDDAIESWLNVLGVKVSDHGWDYMVKRATIEWQGTATVHEVLDIEDDPIRG